ncbi:Histone-lysine N-methyltransferase setd3 [Geranomyces variabilis]|uniref:Histone-lysine N-methyltransferase setd3 n=1 Tax=Geranomyces variabilis TaxID=109894 RepID=A0AAD5XMX3_9FUNG|nr:Histone-lysine N-methyltransferase setd3 [Geranomyces variabilis]
MAEAFETRVRVDVSSKRAAEPVCPEVAVKDRSAGHVSKARKLDQQSALDALIFWAAGNGASVSGLVFRDPDSNCDSKCTRRSAFTDVAIAANGEIASIPASLILSESTARNSLMGARLHEYLGAHSEGLTQKGRDPYAPGLILLSAFMVFERFENPDSFWKPYLEALPGEYELPLYWSDAEVEHLLKGTNLHHVVRERRKLLEKGLDMAREACGQMFANGSLLWYDVQHSGLSCYKMMNALFRRQGKLSVGIFIHFKSSLTIALHPQLNHQRGQRIEWRIQEGVGVSFVALEEVACGAEVFNNYGAKGNENLLGNYGFVLDPNPEDYVKIALNIQDLDPCAAQKRAILARLMPNRLVHLLFEGDDEIKLPEDLMAVTRLMVMNPAEVMQAERYAGDALKSTVNPRNEILALGTLWQLLKRKIAEVKQTAARNAEPESSRERIARVYRDSKETMPTEWVSFKEK